MPEEKPKEEVKEETQEAPTLVVEIMPDDSINVTGKPLLNEPIALWMLEKAKDTVKMYHMKLNMEKQKKQIVPAKGGIMGFVRGGKRF